ncbi:hypothetical protein [Phenylobacterium sp.]|jgi:hypothetical protein|uniref:hypothetical protein n=1 Tax=Phenylobacterium sp. TaxID=1871053 RepID=UPI002F3FEE65
MATTMTMGTTMIAGMGARMSLMTMRTTTMGTTMATSTTMGMGTGTRTAWGITITTTPRPTWARPSPSG